MSWATRIRKFNPCHDPEDGKFTTGPCGDSGLTGVMQHALEANGGFTFDPRTKSTPTKGFAVGGFGTKPVFDQNDFRMEMVEKFLKDNASVLKEGAYIGGWLDGGKVYLDVTKIFDDKDAAIKAGIEKNQIAVADMSKIAEKDFDHAFINTGGTGKRDSKPKMFLFDGTATAEEIYAALAGVAKYDPNQPRDPKGKPTGGQWARTVPIQTSDIEVAIMALQKGIPVELDQPDQISTLLDRLQSIAKEMEAKGEKAPTVNLCQVSVKGTNLFCAESLGYARVEMPQLKGKPAKGSRAYQEGEWDAKGRVDVTNAFVKYLEKHGYAVFEDVELASHMRATQAQIDGVKVARIMAELRSGFGTPKTVIISSDNYILDGHHHWAATVGVDYFDGNADMTMKVLRVDTKIIDLLQRANKFSSKWGIPHKKREVQSIAKTLYVRRDLVNAEELVRWAKDIGFKTTLPPEKMHVTVIYSKTPCQWEAMRPAGEPALITVDGGPRSMERLGPDAVVLRFESDYLTGRCNDLKSKGAVSDFPEYKAHVTITWDAPDLDVEEIVPFLGTLIFGPEIFEEVNLEFRSTIVEKAYDPSQPREPKGRRTGGQWTSLVSRAKKFATEAHGAQKRKYTGEPYTVHLDEVAQLVREAGLDEDVQAAAWLHDVLEDTHVTEATMRAEFGDLITSYVKQVTDVSRPWDGNRAARKALDAAHLARATDEGASIKLADMISNTRSIVAHDPSFARVYLKEKAAILSGMKGGSSYLRKMAEEASAEAYARLEKYDPDQPRAPKGTAEGGQWIDDPAHVSADRARFQELKNRWAQINNELLNYVDKPDAPQAKELMGELKSITKEIYGLNVDPGGLEGIGLPGGPRDVVIIGAGPGGLSAAIMSGTDGLDTLIIDGNTVPGGQAKYSSRIENFPGFPVGVSGEQLTTNMMDQAERVGVEAKLGVRVTKLEYDAATGLKTLTLANGEVLTARTVILAGGVEFRQLEFEGADQPDVVYGDGKKLAELTTGSDACVIGGSNGAAQAALGVARFANRVTVLSRSPITKDMSDYQVQALRNHPKITVIEGETIQAFVHDDAGISKYVVTSGGHIIPAKAVGVFAGSKPNTNWLPTDLISPSGRVKVNNSNFETTIPGVYAVGDIREGSIGRIGAAVGEGQMASKGLWDYFYATKKRQS